MCFSTSLKRWSNVTLTVRMCVWDYSRRIVPSIPEFLSGKISTTVVWNAHFALRKKWRPGANGGANSSFCEETHTRNWPVKWHFKLPTCCADNVGDTTCSIKQSISATCVNFKCWSTISATVRFYWLANDRLELLRLSRWSRGLLIFTPLRNDD